jgi:hypothetical protein
MAQNIKQTFTSAQYLNQAQYSTGYAFEHIGGFVTGDFDRNGYIDIMSFPMNFTATDGSYQFKPVTWLNTDGMFTASDTITDGLTGQTVRDVIVDDFNNDGITDYMTVDTGWESNNRDPNSFQFYYPRLLLGTSSGLYYIPDAQWNKSYSTARVFNHIGDSADFDKDGDADVVIAAFGGSFKLYQNNGDGTFTNKPELFNWTSRFGPSGASFIKLGNEYAMVIGGYVDGVFNGVPYTNPLPTVMKNVNGVFTESYTLSRPVWNNQMANAGMIDTDNIDINNDGREDLLMTFENEANNRSFLSVYLQDASNNLVKSADYLMSQNAVGAYNELRYMDIDKDGDLDIYAFGWNNKITELDKTIYLNDGYGNFTHPVNFFNLINYTPWWNDKLGVYEIYDANNDGAVDLVVISQVFSADNSKSIGQQVHVFLAQTGNLSSTPITISNRLSLNNVNASIGNDFIHDTNSASITFVSGGLGVDTSSYSKNFSTYQITRNAAGTYTVAGNGIADTLVEVERLQFADKTFDLINPPISGTPGYGKIESFLFDAAYYLLKNPELVPSVTLATAYENYKKVGAATGDAPNAWFDAVYYANKWTDLKPLNLDAVTLFAHYNLYGVWEGRSAGPTFDKYDGTRYLKDNPDVAAYVDAYVADFLGSRSNGAIAHYVIYGAAEGRVAYDTTGVAIEQAILIGVPG